MPAGESALSKEFASTGGFCFCFKELVPFRREVTMKMADLLRWDNFVSQKIKLSLIFVSFLCLMQLDS